MRRFMAVSRIGAPPLAVALLVAASAWNLSSGAEKKLGPHPRTATHAVPSPIGKSRTRQEAAAPAQTGQPAVFDTAARNAIVVDFESGRVLLDKNADQRMPTASMSKIMTAYVVYSDIRDGKVKLEDELPVSQEAWHTGGSKMFVPYPGKVKVEDLIRGMIIQSGNDACVVLAEGLAGSTQAFVEQMNEMAKKLGLDNSHFANVDGLPDPEHYMSPRDLASLARHLITDFPQFYRYESEKEFAYNGIKQGNRNPLLYKDLGADGIKTGHTDEAGYGLVGSAVRNGRRVIFVISGLPSMNARASESDRVLEWSYREFEDVTVAKAGEAIDDAPVWLGATATVPVSAAHDSVVTLARGARKGLKVTASYDGPAKAPIKEGEAVGTLTVTVPDQDAIAIPLVALKPVDRLGAAGRVAASLAQYILGAHN
jgi:serine-type D-Ala-D-Ala carboxypeptidase (penicillin-binding protein 5/6)